jgi:hypothetical protein
MGWAVPITFAPQREGEHRPGQPAIGQQRLSSAPYRIGFEHSIRAEDALVNLHAVLLHQVRQEPGDEGTLLGATSPHDIVVMAVADEMQQELLHSASTAYTYNARSEATLRVFAIVTLASSSAKPSNRKDSPEHCQSP